MSLPNTADEANMCRDALCLNGSILAKPIFELFWGMTGTILGGSLIKWSIKENILSEPGWEIYFAPIFLFYAVPAWFGCRPEKEDCATPQFKYDLRSFLPRIIIADIAGMAWHKKNNPDIESNYLIQLAASSAGGACALIPYAYYLYWHYVKLRATDEPDSFCSYLKVAFWLTERLPSEPELDEALLDPARAERHAHNRHELHRMPSFSDSFKNLFSRNRGNAQPDRLPITSATRPVAASPHTS